MNFKSYYSKTRPIEWWLWGCRTEEEHRQLIKALKDGELKLTAQQVEERRKKRELVDFLSYDANFKTGTYTKSKVTLHRGEVKRTVRELSLILQIPRTTLIRYLKELKELGFISIRREKQQTIITLHFYPQHIKKSQETQGVDTQNAESLRPKSQNCGHPYSSVHRHLKPNSENHENEELKVQKEVSTDKAMDTSNQQIVDTQNAESWTPKTQNRGHKKNKKVYEEKEDNEEKEENNNNTHTNIACESEESEAEFERKKLKEVKEEVKREIEATAKGLEYKQVKETVEKIRLVFKKAYKEVFKVPPVFPKKALSVLVDYCMDQESVEELKEFEEKLLSKIPVFFRSFKDDKFVQDRRYDFVALVHRIPQLLYTYERDGSIKKQEGYEFEEVKF